MITFAFERRGLLRMLWLVAVIASLSTLMKYGVWKARESPVSIAFQTYYEAATKAANKKCPYELRNRPNIYCYPLLLAAALIPLSHIEYEKARLLWYIGNWVALFLIIAIIVLWARNLIATSHTRTPRERGNRVALTILLVIGYVPLLYTFSDGQIDLWVSAITLAGFYLARFGRRGIAGVLVAVAILLKIAPILWLPGLIFLLKKRGILAAIISVVIYELFIGLMGWWKWEWFLASEILPRWQFHTALPSFSLFHIVYNWGMHLGFAGETVTAWALRIFWAGRIVALSIYALILWLGWKRRLSAWACAGLAVLISYYIMAIMEPNHLIWIVVPMIIALLEGSGKLSILEIGVVGVVWLLGSLCFESVQTMGLWWGFQFGFFIPICAAILYYRQFKLMTFSRARAKDLV